MSSTLSNSILSNDEQQQLLEQLAYQSWLSRGCPLGSPEVDWHHAVTILNTQLTLVGSEQSRSDKSSHLLPNQQSTYDELGNDEDTPSDPVSLSPFAAQSEGAEVTALRPDGADTSAKASPAIKRASRGRKRE
jgi:hypothetical protein